MKNATTSNATLDHGTIAQTAKGLWEQAGRPPGRDLEFWLSAETQLKAGSSAKAQKPATQGQPAMGQGWISPTLTQQQPQGQGSQERRAAHAAPHPAADNYRMRSRQH